MCDIPALHCALCVLCVEAFPPVNAPYDPRIDPILAGDRRAIARAISAVENDAPGTADLVAMLGPHLGAAHVVGITGAPGAGKSTLVNALLREWLARGRRVAVVAVDPSSPVSGGAVLGDRIRMTEGGGESVFIRSLASRGHLGGLSRATRGAVDVFDAARFDFVVVETVGAGQSEVEVRGIADTTVVVCPPGLGDDIQAIKAGILEIADLLVVSKGDSPLAERTLRELSDMVAMRRAQGWRVPVLKTTGTNGDGVATLADRIAEHAARAGSGRRVRAHGSPGVDAVEAVDLAITSRRAVRRFLPAPVAREVVEEILAVASRAPSGTNMQPWKAYVLAGDAKAALSAAILEALACEPETHAEEHPNYPSEWVEPYRSRRRAIGLGLYGLLGIGKGDAARAREQFARNYVFFDAPVGFIFTIDRILGRGSWLDYGMFLQNIMVAARARGLDTCPQQSFARFHRVVERELALPANETVVVGMALGHADTEAPENRLATMRAPVAAFAKFMGFE
jgi:LAO/AO transport system ATPase